MPEKEKKQEQMAEVFDFNNEKERIKPKTESKVGKLKPVRKEVGANTIDLTNESGQKIGQAEYGLVTTPDFLQKVNVDLDNRTEKVAMEAAEKMEDPTVAQELAEEEITEQSLEGLLDLAIMKFNLKCGGEVFEARNIIMHDGRFEKKSTKSQPEKGKLARNFIIAPSGAEVMRGILAESIKTSVGAGTKFDINPYTSDFLGDEGFSYIVSATTPGGETKQVEVNFLYGVEGGAEAVDSPEEEEQTNVTELHKKPEESASDEEEQLPLAA
ncbi:MAG: hypothetical protein HOA57_03310 [Candidatus Magasanikbacteria bacterium]|jgi:hypothetical protein|nr:hypothetical protein [Candidatus Magasanikbacteria bacterium]MBT4314777.1 hypothetical protein [Candidatus Magasanikbacteria bacterium]MBT4547554.1 hypothetical protein [Candidatus Magasanikbacteria bacterium]MBT6819380.1 hypothetical protein [Candidatus Magasanikbacteria bacterium]